MCFTFFSEMPRYSEVNRLVVSMTTGGLKSMKDTDCSQSCTAPGHVRSFCDSITLDGGYKMKRALDALENRVTPDDLLHQIRCSNNCMNGNDRRNMMFEYFFHYRDVESIHDLMNSEKFPAEFLERYILFLLRNQLLAGEDLEFLFDRYLYFLNQETMLRLLLESEYLSRDADFFIQVFSHLQNKYIDILLSRDGETRNRITDLFLSLNRERINELLLKNSVIFDYILMFLDLDGKEKQAEQFQKEYDDVVKYAKQIDEAAYLASRVKKDLSCSDGEERGDLIAVIVNNILNTKDPDLTMKILLQKEVILTETEKICVAKLVSDEELRGLIGFRRFCMTGIFRTDTVLFRSRGLSPVRYIRKFSGDTYEISPPRIEKKIDFDLNSFLLPVSFALDFIEMNVLGVTSNHSKRIALTSLLIAEKLGMSDEEKYDLVSYAVLHDNGLTQEILRSSSIDDHAPMDPQSWISRHKEHCEIGEQNIQSFPFLTKHRDVIRYHHERWDGKGIFGIGGEQIPLMAQIIFLTDSLDILLHLEQTESKNRQVIRQFVEEKRGSWYSDALVNAFLAISNNNFYWFHLREPHLSRTLYAELGKLNCKKTQPASWKDVFEIARVFSVIIDSKSHYTFRHSTGLLEKAAIMTDHYDFDSDRKYKFLIAVSLHDLGKLRIPKHILDKPGKLNYEEMEMMRSHVFYTKLALKDIPGFGEIADWASNHHERMDGLGYPRGLKGSDLTFEDRLIACLDVYQALSENRPYRDAMTHDESMDILRRFHREGALDPEIIDHIGKVFRK